MDERNPYRPPEASLGLEMNRPGVRFRPVVTVVRVLVALWGLFILAGPSRTVPVNPGQRQGQITAKALGALLFVVAIFPFRRPRGRKVEAVEGAPEDL